MSYLGNFFVSVDQLGNVLAGGNPDNTISSRIGYYNYHHPNGSIQWQWLLFRKIVDFSFYPIDGPNHCHEAFHNDAGELFDPNTKNWMIVFASFIIIPSCVLISTLLYSLWLVRLVSPKRINRELAILDRIRGAKAKLKGVLAELEEHEVDINEAHINEARETLQLSGDVLGAFES